MNPFCRLFGHKMKVANEYVSHCTRWFCLKSEWKPLPVKEEIETSEEYEF